MSTKQAIKSIKARIGSKDHEAALYEATELLKNLDDKDPVAADV
jgi:superkiller protein 3